MTGSAPMTPRVRILIAAVLFSLAFAAVAVFGSHILRDVQDLNAAHKDNLQWSLSQTDVEFLEFYTALVAAKGDGDGDLNTLRREFDIFYSRIRILNEAELYAPLRELPRLRTALGRVDGFLQGALPAIDASNAELRQNLPDLAEQAADIRPVVRDLSISALGHLVALTDARREQTGRTLVWLGLSVGGLIVALLALAGYLNHLNSQNVRRRAEVVEASRRMNVVMGTSLDGVIISDTTGRILEFNAAAEQIFAIPAQEVIGRDLADVIVPDHHKAAHAAGMARLRNGGTRRVVGSGRVRLEAKRATGEVFPVELAIQSAETAQGEIFVAFLRDISAQVAAEEELISARDLALAGEKAKTNFLATMSHEIRTPLNGLLGNLTLLQDTRLTARQRRYIGNMETSGKLLLSHINGVLDITKYDAGRLHLRPVVMNISDLVQDIIDNQSASAAANQSVLEWQWDGPAKNWIRADKDRLQDILMNLVGNAVKFTHNGRIRVTLACLGRENGLQIVVEDTGIGITPDQIRHVFEDFVTGDSSYARNVGGTGLGLALTKRFVTALGGHIDVESTPGQGSSFIVELPVEEAEPPQPAGPIHARQARGNPITGPRKVLLVEDNPINRDVAREMLRAAGHYVVEAHNGREAVDLARAGRFDLILMDISMPVMDGRSATRAIRALNGPASLTPIVALTANVMAEEQATFLEDGMDGILTKPLSKEALLGLFSSGALPEQLDEICDQKKPAVSDEHLQSLKQALSPDGARVIVARFCKEIDELVGWLGQEEGEQRQDLPRIAAEAHKSAGSAATIGALCLRRQLIAIEEAAKSGSRADLALAIDGLPAIWLATQSALKSAA
ncbi:hybrid sensor histidine kinase/response regulator [Phaeobacter italicus]|uniref:hybrid sensor histidine kinase/response regulator n=1 Tax=Phaeobacter italicus TaxID=481446 RepID=UPI00242E8CA2|nr:ATP-binding protein [Phaeobacter italicus]MCI5101524.1 ATP-binding protein [Phaeobacter italicus]